MSTPASSLDEALRDPGFTPGKRHLGALVEAALSPDQAVARAASKALARAQHDVGPLLLERFARGSAPEQRALAKLAGRLAQLAVHSELSALLTQAVGSSDARVRRAAANALGRARIGGAAELLSAALERETDASVRPYLIEALGKVGGRDALDAIASATQGEPQSFDAARATLMASRTELRAQPSRVDAGATVGPVTIALRCREGLEEVLLAELAGSANPRLAPPRFGAGCVDVEWTGPLAGLFAARTFLRFGLASAPFRATHDAELRQGIVAALTAPSTLALLRKLTEGPIRYRIGFASGGKRRRSIWEAALEVARLAPDLVNDPTDSVWEALVVEAQGGDARLELTPALEDPRFRHRVAEVPAASHPTIAAALVRVAGARPDDVVWDPFVGSGLELAERALLGPYRALIGTDIDARALSIARANLEQAGARVDLRVADALTFVPTERVSLIVTNPPMGRRVLRGEPVVDLLTRFLARAPEVLAEGGRIVWLSPAARDTRRAGAAAGLALVDARPVDMGGMRVELQHWKQERRAPAPRGPTTSSLARSNEPQRVRPPPKRSRSR